MLLSTLVTIVTAQAFRAQNSADARRLDNAKATNKVGDSCNGADVVCIGDAVGQCVNGQLQINTACPAPLKCQVLPLRNKPGTSVACDTDEDKEARIKEFEVAGTPPAQDGGVKQGDGQTNQNGQQTGTQAGTEQTGTAIPNSFQCIDDTKFKQFISTNPQDFVIGSCPPGFCATRTPPIKNPCIGKERAAQIDKTE